MKKYKIAKIAIAFTSLLIATSCTKFDDDINVSPNKPLVAYNSDLFTYAMRYVSNTSEATQGALYVQQLAETQYTDASRYTNVAFDWSVFYANPLMNLQYIISQPINPLTEATEGSANNQKAVARILRAYFYWHLTDRWGDIPYAQALQGSANFAPVYTSQKDVYYDLMKELKEAAAQIDGGKGVKTDFLYNKNMSKWKKLANTMRALMALRISKVDQTKAQTEFNDAIASGVFASNADNFVYPHLEETANQNFWFSALSKDACAPSATLVDYLISTNDPRLTTFANKNKLTPAVYAGMPYGLMNDEASQIPSKNISTVGDKLRQKTSSTQLITYAQLLFAKAEAAKAGIISGGDAEAQANYNLAIENSLIQWNGDNTGLTTFLADPAVAYDSNNAIKLIAYQRWVHLYMNGYEAWAEWRRTGYPQLTAASGTAGIPTRQAYPSSEFTLNRQNYDKAKEALGGKDDLYGRVWWNKQN
ncbi:Starch-binding associating with outer membrane [compost metagenome]